MSQAQPKKDLFHVALSKQIAEQITRGTASFLTAHENERIDLPYNPVTGKNYTAANNMVLSAKGYADSRWLTYDQAAEQGYQVKKGEKATEIAYYHYVDYNTKEKLDKPKIQTVKLFNAQQLIGIEKMPSRTSSKEEALAKVQSIFENSQVKIVNNQKNKDFYLFRDDTIYMRSKDAYKDDLAYSSAVLHQFCLWAACGENRLNYGTVPFGTEAFARQKLRAEISTYMLCKEIGLPFEPEGEQFAVQWSQIIEKHPFEILNAAKDAEKIKGFVMEFDKTLEKTQELEQESPQKERRYIEPNEYTDYFTITEYGPGGTHRFNCYDISQLHAAFEKKGNELVDVDRYIAQLQDSIEMNDGDDELVTFFTQRLAEVELAVKENQYTYVVENTTYSSDLAFLYGNTYEELINSISSNGDALHMLDVQGWNVEPKCDKDVYLTVPENHIEMVQKLGAEFDEEENRWYVPKDTDLIPFDHWMYEEVEVKHEQQLQNENAAAVQVEQTHGQNQEMHREEPAKEQPKQLKLSVSYADKDEIKALGAKWSKQEQSWYVLEGTDLQPFYKWLPKEKKVELIMASRDYLDVPREEKDEAKALGAKWDKYQKAWYVEKGTDLEPFAKWNKLDLTERNISQTAEQTPKEQAVSQTAEPKQEQTEKEVSAEQNPAQDKTFIAVPYDERKEAKALGAKWDAENKSWYVEKGADLNKFKEWLVDENTVVPAKQEAVSPEIEFAEHCRANGLDVDTPIMDGQIHRVPLIGKPGGKDGAYCGYLDGVPSGWSQNYVTGEKSKFVSSGVQLTEEEKAKQRAEHARKLQEREAKRQRDYDVAANNAKRVLNNSFEADKSHAYLQEKGIKPYIARQNNYNQLVVPVQNIHGDIRGVQFIEENGSKKFLSGIEKKGNFALLSEEAKDVSKALVCEGFATGASLHEATKLPVVVAFDAGNLEEVSKALAEKYKGIEITVCADNDQYKDNNVGLECAKKAALAVNGKLAVPQFTKEEQARKLTDFNDLHKAEGLEAVTRQISQARSLTQKQSKQSQLAR